MQFEESKAVEPRVHKASMVKQVMESRSHPLDMIREALSNMTTPEVGASAVAVQHYLHPDYGATFRFRDDGCGMTYTGDEENPGRLDRFIGLGYSKAAGLSADTYGWKGLGSKLMLNCRRLEAETWTGRKGEDVFSLLVVEPRSHFIQDIPDLPEFVIGWRPPSTTDTKGTVVTVNGYDGGKREYSYDEIKRYLYLNTVVGKTKDVDNVPETTLKVGNHEGVLRIGYKWVTAQNDSAGNKSWRTVVVDPPITVAEITEAGEEVAVVLKGGFTLDTGTFSLTSHRRNTGLRLAVKGIPYFQLDFYSYKGNKFQQYKDLCSFVVECDAIESKLNMDRSSISNQFGDDQVVKTFKSAVEQAFDQFAESDDCKAFFELRAKEDEKSKAEYLNKRVGILQDPRQEFVCIQPEGKESKILHRVPDNEADTLALFWKLEGAGLLPMEEFVSFEHTGKSGIDVIANIQETEDSRLKIMESVEFEYLFENFIKHKHNPRQTSSVICWKVERPAKIQQLNPYTYRAEIDDCALTVYEIRNFPNIAIKKASEVLK